jgi:16S rRNA A1518/A1519 N6-dimethyltransferase RsmA/KsgA/DIM1 with predicted DNA glycosylase/AP lyase activity
VWGEHRRKLVQMLWGQGFTMPGGAEYAINLVNGFLLNPAVSMLEVGACLGGGTRAVVDKFRAYVTGLEPDEELAKEGMAISKVYSISDKAPIHPLDIKSLELKENIMKAS